MTSVLVLTASQPVPEAWLAELKRQGLRVLSTTSCASLVDDALRWAPEAIVCWEPAPDETLFEACRALAASAPRALVLLTSDTQADTIARAVRSGVHGYTVGEWAAQRWPALIQIAQARWAHELDLQAAAQEAQARLDERKLVDRAKGILMQARQLSEGEAFSVLRKVSMTVNQRMAWVSQHVIDAAQGAQAVNRAGQLRMLSQRLIKLRILRVLDTDAARADALLRESMNRIEDNLAMLSSAQSARGTAPPLAKAGGDAVTRLTALWPQLRAALDQATTDQGLAEADDLAEAFLLQAEQLTQQIETHGVAHTLHIINLAGRQRMLSQRVTKLALLGAHSPSLQARGAEDLKQSRLAFERALADLQAMPLSTTDIQAALTRAQGLWRETQTHLINADNSRARSALFDNSEALLGLFEDLVQAYERSVQVLIG